MTEAQKAPTFDLLQRKRVIVVRKGPRSIGGKMMQRTWVEHGETKDIVVDDFVTTLEAEGANSLRG